MNLTMKQINTLLRIIVQAARMRTGERAVPAVRPPER